MVPTADQLFPVGPGIPVADHPSKPPTAADLELERLVQESMMAECLPGMEDCVIHRDVGATVPVGNAAATSTLAGQVHNATASTLVPGPVRDAATFSLVTKPVHDVPSSTLVPETVSNAATSILVPGPVHNVATSTLVPEPMRDAATSILDPGPVRNGVSTSILVPGPVRKIASSTPGTGPVYNVATSNLVPGPIHKAPVSTLVTGPMRNAATLTPAGLMRNDAVSTLTTGLVQVWKSLARSHLLYYGQIEKKIDPVLPLQQFLFLKNVRPPITDVYLNRFCYYINILLPP